MKNYKILIIIIILFVTACGNSNPEAVNEAKKSAIEWLDYIDNGMYMKSHEEAATLFKSTVSEEDWQVELMKTRKPLGDVKKRILEKAKYKTSISDMPDGEYVVIKYSTNFSSNETKEEVITVLLNGENQWRVTKYYIK